MFSLALISLVVFLFFKLDFISPYERAKIIAKIRKNIILVYVGLGLIWLPSIYHAFVQYIIGLELRYTEQDIIWFYDFLDIKILKYSASHFWDSFWLLLGVLTNIISVYFFKNRISTDRKKRSYLCFFLPVLISSLIILFVSGLLYMIIFSLFIWGIIWFAVYYTDKMSVK